MIGIQIAIAQYQVDIIDLLNNRKGGEDEEPPWNLMERENHRT